MIYIVLLQFIQFINALSPQYSVINCTWPCLSPGDKCVVTENNANCQPISTNAWIMNSPTKAPIYTGLTVTLPSRSCISVPIPQLPLVNQSNTLLPGQSIIYWPVVNSTRRIQDEYLGNCGRSLYCYHSTCYDRFALGSACNSSNQCAYGFCDNGTCHSLSNRFNNFNRQNDPKIIAAIATVFSVAGILLISGLIYHYRAVLFKTKKQTIVQSQVERPKHEMDSPPPYEP